MSKALDIVIVAIVCGVVGWFAGCDHGRHMGVPSADSVRVVFKPIPVHDTLRADRWRVVYQDTGRIDSVPVVRLQTQIETLLVHERVKQYTVCADTVMRKDTIHVCYNYVGQTFAIGVAFAERDGVVAVRPKASWLSWHPVALLDVSLDKQVFGGAGFEAGAGPVRITGVVGFQREPFAATAHAQLAWVFE